MQRWLPEVLPQTRTFISEEGRKGEDWFLELHRQLSIADAGIVCITKESWHTEWLHFEAGALFAAGKPVCVVLLGTDHAEYARHTGPLSRFQASKLDHIDDVDDRKDLRRLAAKLNSTSGTAAISSEDLEARLDRTWPDLKFELRAALFTPVQQRDRRKENAERHEEVMAHLRALDRYYRDILYLLRPPGAERSLIDHLKALHEAHRDIIETIRPEGPEITIGGPPH
jgi:hypothetical protein